jgi:membrane protein
MVGIMGVAAGLPRRLMTAVDGWQRRVRWAGVPYAVLKKSGDDNVNLLVVALAWYGFTSIFPLLLVVVTVFGFIGEQSIGAGLVRTLHEFPVVGSEFNPASPRKLHGSALGLIVGLVFLLYGAQGVTQTAQQAMAAVWNIPLYQRTGFLPRLGRSLAGLVVIGIAFVVNAFVTGYAGGAGYAIKIPVLAGLLVLNAGLYFASFTVLTAKVIGPRGLIPGAVAGAVVFTALITIGTGLITHQLKNASTTYGAFGTVIGIVAFLLLLAKLTLYAAELNPVLARGLYPRALPLGGAPTDADQRVIAELVQAQQRRADQAAQLPRPDTPARPPAPRESQDQPAERRHDPGHGGALR